MNREIYFNDEELNKIIESLNKKKDKLIEIIDKQKNMNEKMHMFWGGTSGDKAYEALKKHEKKYESYINAINIRIDFLEKVKRSYLNLDDYLNKKINDNGNIDA